MPIITCNQCGKEFKTPSTKRKFCSVKCSSESKHVINKFICHQCGKMFHRRTDNNPELKHIFCSHKCYSKNRKTIPLCNCTNCGTPFTPTTNGRTFCSRVCYESFRTDKIEKICIGCHTLFTVNKSIAHRYNYCSFNCKKQHSKNVVKHCERCGKSFEHKGSDIERGLDRHFCSEKCRRPPIFKTCPHCGKSFRKGPLSQVIFCGRRCYRSSKGETSIETKMRIALDTLQCSYVQEYKIGRYLIDFALVGIKVAIETDGIYWHDPIKDQRRDSSLNKQGWRVLRFPEIEINNTKNLCNLIRRKLHKLPHYKTICGKPPISFYRPNKMVTSAK